MGGRMGGRMAILGHRRPAGQSQQHGHQVVQVEGLADVIVHADCQARFAVGGHGVGGHGDDGQGELPQILADAGGGGVAVHHRHLQVHQHDVESRVGGGHGLDRQQAVVGNLHLGTFVLEQFARHLLVVGVVFHHQQTQTRQALSGRRRRQAQAGRGVGVSARIDDGVVEHRRRDRFDQIAVHQRLFLVAALRKHLAAMGCDHDQRRHLACLQRLTDQRAGLQAVQARHLPVDEDRIEGGVAVLQAGQGRLAAVGQHDLPAQPLRHAPHQLARDQVVIDHQHVQLDGLAQTQRRHLRAAVFIAHRQLDAEMEAAAATDFAVQPQFAAHQAHQAPADRQAQAGTTEAARGRGFGLREAAEDVLLVFRRNADARIAHRHVQRHRCGAARHHRHRHHHLAAGGELDRIAAQIDQHLLQAQRVAHQHRRQLRVDVEQHFDRLAGGAGTQDHGQVAQQLIRAERVQVQRHLAGLDLAEVEDVVQQPEQRARSALGLAGVVGLSCRQLGLLQQRQHAQDGVHRRTDFVAHVGQELALRSRSLLRRLGGAHELGDIDAEAHRMPVGHLALDDAHGSSITQPGLQIRRGLPMHGQPLLHPGLLAADGGGVLTARRATADDLLEGVADHNEFSGQRVHAAVALVAQHQAVFGVEQRVGAVQRIDRAAHQRADPHHLGLGALAGADVGVGGDEATAGHRAASDLQRRAVGADALEAVRYGLLFADAGEDRLHRGFGVARAVFTARSVVADDVLETGVPN